ncbi:hypothetical protein [Frankia nepalensis]|uniref:hypothetical protein n=1 Tax=Frankia nepalensis TaxID=1836974 RepID=UPI001EE45D91|nr:hypothetical protein [Frankia nepalensis]
MLGKAQGLDEVALCQAMGSGVIRHPAGQQHGLGNGGEQLLAGGGVVAAVEQGGGVAGQETDQAMAGVASAVAVVEVGKQRAFTCWSDTP